MLFDFNNFLRKVLENLKSRSENVNKQIFYTQNNVDTPQLGELTIALTEEVT